MAPSVESMDHGPCCAASRAGSPQDDELSAVGPRSTEVTSGKSATPEMVRLEGGEFLMGTEDTDGFDADGEGPVRAVTLKPFWIDAYAVANARSGTGYLVGPGLRRKLASSRGPALLHRRSYGSPGGARLLERRGLLLLVVGDEATYGGRVGVCSPRRARTEALRVGRRTDTRWRVALQHLAGHLPFAQHLGGRLPGHGPGDLLSAQRPRTLQRLGQRLGVVF